MFKKRSGIQKQFDKAWRLLKKFFSIRVIQILLLVLFILAIGPLVLFYFIRPKVQHNINYGVTFSKKYAEQMGLDWRSSYIQILDDLGAKNLRLVAYWDDSERDKDSYNFDDIKWQLNEAEKRNLNVILTVGRKVPRYPECFEPEWWKEMGDEDLKRAELLEYLKVAVNELKGYNAVKMWQVENEPFWPFGECEKTDKETLTQEIKLVRSIDSSRPIIIQDSGEGGLWFETYSFGDYLGISMYRKIWYNFWNIFLGNFIYFQYPLSHWSYKVKATLMGVPMDKIYVTELQAEPWGPGSNHLLDEEEKNKTMSKTDFISTLSYAQKAGFKDLYFWGVEWWLFEKDVHNNPYFWDTAKALFRTN